MKLPARIFVVTALALVVVGAVALKKAPQSNTTVSNSLAAATANTAGLPRLVDLGSSKCIPCKMMTPILEDLKKEYAGRMSVDFFDVVLAPEIGQAYNVNLIPTQIFFDAAGKELFRHEGFFGKEDILAKWKELGVNLTGKSDAAPVN